MTNVDKSLYGLKITWEEWSTLRATCPSDNLSSENNFLTVRVPNQGPRRWRAGDYRFQVFSRLLRLLELPEMEGIFLSIIWRSEPDHEQKHIQKILRKTITKMKRRGRGDRNKQGARIDRNNRKNQELKIIEKREKEIMRTGLLFSCKLTNLMHKILFYNKFIKCLHMFRALCAHHQEVKIVLHSIWYHHTLQVAVRCTGWVFSQTCAPDGQLQSLMMPGAV